MITPLLKLKLSFLLILESNKYILNNFTKQYFIPHIHGIKFDSDFLLQIWNLIVKYTQCINPFILAWIIRRIQ